MNEVTCYDNETGKVFVKTFDNIREQRRFMLRCKRSKKITLLGFTWQSSAEFDYLEYGR